MPEYTMTANQRAPLATLPPEDLERRVLRWLQTEAGFAQVFSINNAGYPVGRTMAAPVDEHFTVWLAQRKVHKRLLHWKRNPRAEVVWMGTPAPDSRNDSPHVYDCNLLVPRGVFLRGDAEFLDEATLVDVFERQTALHRGRGWTKAPERSRDNIVSELVGVRIRAIQIRAEGFGEGAASYVWQPGRRP